ncbi:glycoside hydrolase family 51 protein [Cenococcum geophilum 1.58]|uniref:glycoside hydrolase family 51 protein n=1 Tax=Cenococcum geophilum 1.58 TaxID=794803 RepID=UPI00358EA42E|nr:glycoside hydrolase family 51 protein [Cenococcum geophilum 1.58]
MKRLGGWSTARPLVIPTMPISDGKMGERNPITSVRYWTLGNEMWGPWQVGQTTKEDYAKKVYQWAKALKLLEPSIELVLCSETGFSTICFDEWKAWDPARAPGDKGAEEK